MDKINKKQLRQIIIEELQTMRESSKNSEADSLAILIKRKIRSIFPKSTIDVSFTTKFVATINIRFLLATKKDWYNGIEFNDPVRALFSIDGFNNDGDILGDMVITLDNSVWYELTQGSKKGFMAPVRKVPFRKTRGDSKKILLAVEKYFKKLHATMTKDKDIIVKSYATKYL